jgi:hypothetical protein
LAFAPAVAAGAALVVLVANGVLAASFAVSGSAFKVSASRLDGQGFKQFGGTDHRKVDNQDIPVVITVIDQASLTNLCQSVKIGPFTVRITAGGGNTPAEAEDLVVDAEQILGDAQFTNIDIGVDASDLGVGAPVGMFGQRATTVTINNLRQVAWATTAGTFKLNGLNLRFGSECF